MLEDKHDYQIDLTVWKAYVPDPWVTAVSRQVRVEVMGFYKPALVDFWKNHFWYIELSPCLRHDEVRERALATMHAVPKEAPIREVQFVARSWMWSRFNAPARVIFGVAVGDDGQARWKFEALKSPSALTVLHLQSCMRRLGHRADRVYLVDEAAAHLRVGSCAQVLMGKMHKNDVFFEEIARCLRD